jgi:hypothetical protein
MRRRQGLIRSGLRTAARTAVIAGTATAVSGRVANRQRKELAHHNEPRAQPADSAALHTSSTESGDIVSRLHQLADLKTMGALTDVEFAAAKTRLLKD